jgi:hypothetical protein
MNAGRVIAPYKIMEGLIDKTCGHLKDASIAIAWRKGWPAVEDRIKLGQMKLASDCDRAYKDFDFLLLLNSEVYRNGTANEESLTMTVHHMLLRGAPALDKDGEQKTDEKGRLCWKTRKPPIVEFPEIIKTYGIAKTLGLTADAVAAINDSRRPLLAESEKNVTATDDAWREWPTSCLAKQGLPAGKVKLLEENSLDTMGKLMDRMNRAGAEDFWWKDIRGFGEGGYDATVNAIMNLRANKPDFQLDQREVKPAATAGDDGALEANILRLSNSGMGMKKIAEELSVSERQVRKALGKL